MAVFKYNTQKLVKDVLLPKVHEVAGLSPKSVMIVFATRVAGLIQVLTSGEGKAQPSVPQLLVLAFYLGYVAREEGWLNTED